MKIQSDIPHDWKRQLTMESIREKHIPREWKRQRPRESIPGKEAPKTFAAKKGKIHPTNNRDERIFPTRHPTNNRDERALRTRHSHDDTQARPLGYGAPDTSRAANVQAKQDDPSTAMRANRIDTEDDGRTGGGRYTERRGGRQSGNCSDELIEKTKQDLNDLRAQTENQPDYTESHIALIELMYHTWPHATQRRITAHVRSQMTEKLMSGKRDRVVFELCCEDNSVLSMNVAGCNLTGRVTEALNFVDSRTVTTLHAIVRVAEHMNIDVHCWISIPCTAGCTGQRVNRTKGFKAGQGNFSKGVIRVFLDLATYVRKIDGKVAWERPETNDLWQHNDVQLFIDKWKLKPVSIASSAVGMAFNILGYQDEVYVRKRWKITRNSNVSVVACQNTVGFTVRQL